MPKQTLSATIKKNGDFELSSLKITWNILKYTENLSQVITSRNPWSYFVNFIIPSTCSWPFSNLHAVRLLNCAAWFPGHPRPRQCCSCRCLGCRSGTCFVQAQSTGDLQSSRVTTYPKAMGFKKMLYLDNKSNEHQNTHAQLVLNCCLNMASKKSEPFFIWRILISRHACFIFFSTPRDLKHISI